MPVPRRRRRAPTVGVLLLIALASYASSVSASWSTLETAHFLVHFTEENRSLAYDVAAKAERIHAALTRRIGHAPAAKTHIVIEAYADAPNAYATPVYRSHIRIQPAFPSLATVYLNGLNLSFDDWLTLVLTHEYTHILHMDMRPEIIDRILAVLGRVPLLSSPLLVAPPMVLEGYAVYQESVLEGGRGGGTFYEMFLRGAVLEGRLPELDQVLGSYPLEQWQPGGHVYFYGYAFLTYLADVYGAGTLDLLNERLSQAPMEFGAALAELTGKSAQQLWADWRAYVTEKYREQIRRLEAEEVTPAAVVRTVGRHALFPTPSPSGDRVAVVAAGGSLPELRIVDLATGAEQPVASLPLLLTETIAWHPREGHVVVALSTESPAGNVSTELAEIDLTSGAVRRLSGTRHAYSPSYDPTGTRLAYIKRSGLRTALWIRDLSTGQDALVLDAPDLTLVSVQWAPDADRLALNIWSAEQGAYIAVLDLATGRLLPVAGGGGTFQTPAWSRDGRRLYFAADRTGVFNLYAYDLASGTLTRLTHTLTGLFYPGEAADGSLTAMLYTADGYRLVHITDPAPLAAEEAWIAAGRTPEPVADARALERPYAPGATLLPTFWLPVVQEVAGETELHLRTAGQDILGRVAYSADVGLRMRSGTPRYNIDVVYAVDAERHVSLYGAVRRTSVYGYGGAGASWYDASEVSLGLQWVGTGLNTWHTAQITGTRTALEPLRGSGTAADEHRVELGWQTRAQWGRLTTRVDLLSAVSAALALEEPNAWRLQLDHQQAYTHTASGHGVSLSLRVALSGKEGSLALGSEAHGLALRGFPNAAWSGDFAWRGALAGRLRLRLVERGPADTPWFLKEVVLYPFVEGGCITKRGTGSTAGAVALGAELGITSYLAYGTAEADWRLGIAYGIGSDRPQLYLRAVSRF